MYFFRLQLTLQVRTIALATRAVAKGDLTQKVTGVAVSGEILDLVNTINSMIDQLAIFAAEVKKVAREVGTEGKLGGQAEVGNVEGIWQEITYVLLSLLRRFFTSSYAFDTDHSSVARQGLRKHHGRKLDYSSQRFRTDFGSGYGRRFQSLHHR